jgi:hypothetical protein
VGSALCANTASPKARGPVNGDIRRAAHGYEPTREQAMAAFAKSWRREFVGHVDIDGSMAGATAI